MNKNTAFIFFLFLLIACNSNKKQAFSFLGKAQNLFEQGELSSAKNSLDSIKMLYPKEFEVLKQGLQLRRKIEIAENERNIVFCDSMLIIRLAEAEKMKTGFVFEKNPEYDDVGKYISKNQQLESKLESSYIRTNVNEFGEISLYSVYYGGRPINHTQLKVSKSNGEFTETQPVPYDGGLNYSFVDGGMTTEVVTYSKGRDNGVISFIYNNKESTLKAEYLGRVKHSFTISASDKNVLVKTFDFAVILSDIEKLKKEKEKSTLRIMYLEGKLTDEQI